MPVDNSSHLTSTIISKLYKSRKILLNQLEKRGYDVSNYTEFTIHEIHTMYVNKQMDMLIENDMKHKIYIKYNVTKKLTPNNLYEAYSDLFEMENILDKETDQIIFISKDEPNDTILKTLKQIWFSEKAFLTVYNIGRLLFNILDHQLVPEHIVLDEEETKEVYKKYNITKPHEQIPEISRFDPVAIAIGIRPNQLCKIIRNSRTSLKTNFYRICV